MEAVCRNIYYRSIIYGGLQGSFRVAAEIINHSVKVRAKPSKRRGVKPRWSRLESFDTLVSDLKEAC